MSNSTKKPCFRFIFPDVGAAKVFFTHASEDRDTTRVQHPYCSVHRVSEDPTQVFVTGTGSLIFDANLRERLMKVADELGGHILERD